MTDLVDAQAAEDTQAPAAMEAIGLSKDFRLGRGQLLHAVRDVSFSLHSGTVVALVGESGSGKSTVARMLAGQERPTSGSIELHGKPADLSTPKAFRRHKSDVQMVFQDPFASLNPVHTVRYHLSRPVRLHQGRHSAAEVSAEVNALLAQVRLIPAEQFAGKYPHELSGGQRQRVSFARALAARPTVLLADEPVSMLDVSIRLEMLALLDDLRKRLRLALLYITHDIASARYFADEVLVMYAGQIVEQGPAEPLTQQPAHPYTQLLVASAPDPDNLGSTLRRGSVRAGRQGVVEVPSQGCPFSPRCPLADDRCRAENPALQYWPAGGAPPAPPAPSASRPVSGSGRSAACWHLPEAAALQEAAAQASKAQESEV